MANNSLLIVETPSTTCVDSEYLARQQYDIHRCQSAASAFTTASEVSPAVVLVSAFLPDMQLTDFVRAFSRSHKSTVILVMVESQQCQLAADAIGVGASDYLLKPFTDQQLISAIDQAISLHNPVADLVVSSAASRQVIQLALRAAQTNATVLISGESGTGKERLAQYLHDNSPRSSGPFVAFNCAAIPETMIESMLFGHSKGAYTGAVASQAGKFELANGGTLMLDEISEMPLPLQAKLLRVLQEREVERLGSNQKIKLDIRIIAATNKNLSQQVAQGLFREDLYYRLDVLPLSWPALRERRDDIIPLTEYFIGKYAPSPGYSICKSAKLALQSHHWPGNVRELENVIQRALIMARGMELQVADLMLPTPNIPQASPQVEHNAQGLESSKKHAEYQYVLETLKQFSGHKTKTAAALGVTPRALRYKMAAMREQGIEV
ncbi:sigma-54-dependent Fis family transcriptional regulator [Thalassomonas viridans]|uniref:Sigma-54-dependent Fis family transcriptional regulator n=1 Tax=Thalassomonas viridans TaxID=137584 RepID=A0AAE9Z2P8_9GAMM|nr:sigma-54 dependent transcriptional regulator [Thalassomonas viridans]WDE05152.1 sigma-54-dependent Fis family transcriptional regulator [Thalassomonas viridans]